MLILALFSWIVSWIYLILWFVHKLVSGGRRLHHVCLVGLTMRSRMCGTPTWRKDWLQKKVQNQVLMNPSQNHQSLPPLPHHLNHFSPMRDQIHQRPPHLVTMNSMTKLRNYQWKIKCYNSLIEGRSIEKKVRIS